MASNVGIGNQRIRNQLKMFTIKLNGPTARCNQAVNSLFSI